MKIKAQGNTVEFIPENDLEIYQLGMMFWKIPHTLEVKDKKLKKVSISAVNIWKHLTEP